MCVPERVDAVVHAQQPLNDRPRQDERHVTATCGVGLRKCQSVADS